PSALHLGKDQLPKLERALYRYTESGQRETQRMLKQLPLFSPAFEQALEARGLPAWLQFITLAESRLNPTVHSAAGAAGLWQLMPATARAYGLRVNAKLDERQDPKRSSQAAAALLADLHRQFDDWLLVLAAYNCGPTRLRRIISRTGQTDYASIAHLLPAQTQRYIPRVLAIAAIATHPTCYGFAGPETSAVSADDIHTAIASADLVQPSSCDFSRPTIPDLTSAQCGSVTRTVGMAALQGPDQHLSQPPVQQLRRRLFSLPILKEEEDPLLFARIEQSVPGDSFTLAGLP
ncbi:MAG: lytic transglycosylase domain-containing protein, partial [Lewinella sp.]|nr:lytic transglycosylase domain-containing protein [Lewinella sp.]